VVEQLAQEYKGKVKIVSMNVDVSPDTASSLGIMSIPAIVFFKGGKEVGRLVGGNKQKIEAELKRLV
jgi:thioredoxin 1